MQGPKPGNRSAVESATASLDQVKSLVSSQTNPSDEAAMTVRLSLVRVFGVLSFNYSYMVETFSIRLLNAKIPCKWMFPYSTGIPQQLKIIVLGNGARTG